MSTMSGSSARRWTAAGPGSGDVAYRMQSLTYRPIEIGLDESVSLRTLFRLWLAAAISSAIVFFVFAVISLIVTANASDLDDGFRAGGVLIAGYLFSFIAFWIVLLGARIDEPIDEWKSLVEDQHQAATSAYAAIYGSLRRRSIPVNATAMRVRSDVLAPEIVNNRLVITERSYTVYASVFAYGTSLYIGWMMWRSRRGATLIGQYVKDLIGGILGRTGSVNQMLRTERVRAMREAVHSAVREGADVAVRGTEVSMAATFGHDVPIQDLRGAAQTTYTPPPAMPLPPQPGTGV